jgi:hypothetical protein
VGLAGLRSQDFTDTAIDPRGVLGRTLDHSDPLLSVRVQLPLVYEIRSLDDGFNRIAQVMRQLAELGDHIVIDLPAGIHFRDQNSCSSTKNIV